MPHDTKKSIKKPKNYEIFLYIFTEMQDFLRSKSLLPLEYRYRLTCVMVGQERTKQVKKSPKSDVLLLVVIGFRFCAALVLRAEIPGISVCKPYAMPGLPLRQHNKTNTKRNTNPFDQAL